MTKTSTTFGHYIATMRAQQGLTQRALAARIHHENGHPISPQYLHDIEYDRRMPSSDHLLRQFAKALKLDTDYLYYLVGRLPEDICRLSLTELEVSKGMKALRNAKKHGKRR
ncbi:transcriptional regulator, XRE family (plasmid) [Nitrosococcus oceani ATCC 19707]|uniref:Transcriptional regulator, XRE family n=2 Tax=Nitrosococcus oceani TaxID=1229 RepID=Q3JF45_NITOC|nr:helix-turn-helix transcriptional regulator [Nitrosococcus oceani]ABA56551.1 transcriptional regulator, XRE family [Nitrosococcus oceani ATCC 19707]KFI17772.1 XRE family transcriptional regulator [Nitrosococcus oceani C-27]BBM60827.1 transcriptional regulator [Nitrosococcus oceani]